MDMSVSSLPDPVEVPELYANTAVKRFMAWIFDTVAVFLVTALVATLPLFIGWFFFPVIFLVVSLLYRIGSLANFSATPGMRLMNIEIRNHHGQRLDGTESALHTIAFLISSLFFLPQVASIVLMIANQRGQGLHDLLVGSAAINTPSKH